MSFFSSRVGAFPYEKLANVQSRTRYGGTENASVIFYNENSVTGTGRRADLVTHEFAFGQAPDAFATFAEGRTGKVLLRYDA